MEKRRFVILLMVAYAGTACAQAAAHPSASGHSKKKEPPTAPIYVPAALEPLRLDQTPAVAPQVSYVDGQLMVVAPNSTLIDILKAIHLKTGADLNMPPDALDRVAVRLGPGKPAEVLAALLDGSRFNYVLLSGENSKTISRIILTAKAGASSADIGVPPDQAAAPVVQGYVRPVPPPNASKAELDEEEDPSETSTAGMMVDSSVQDAGSAEQPVAAPESTSNPANGQSPEPKDNSAAPQR
jgi:hypothetical protein